MNFLSSFARLVDRFNERIGIAVAWVALIMVVIQFIVVVLRYVFGIGSVFMQAKTSEQAYLNARALPFKYT